VGWSVSPGGGVGGIASVMMTDMEDDLVRSAASDEEIYRRYSAELTRYATALVGPANAADVVTDAVIDCFGARNWSRIEHKRAYLYRAVLNRARAAARSGERRSRRERLVAPSLAVHSPAPSVDARRALDRLSTQQRAVVYLTYWDDFAPSQVAELLGVGEGTVRKQLARAREQLRRILDERDN
jgi:RNA polymerase sigma-70 factor (ECF subfamily)